MKLSTRLVLITLAALLMIISLIGAFSFTFEVVSSQKLPSETYVEDFGGALMYSTFFSAIALIISTTRMRKFSLIPLAIFLYLLISHNPWVFDSTWKDSLSVSNPWDNMAVVGVVIAGIVASGLSVYISFFAKPKDSSQILPKQ